MGVIYILWLRQLKRYVRSRARMVGSLGQPLLFLLALGFGFGSIYQKAGGGDYMQFLAPGIIAMGILFTAMFTGIELIWDRQFGFLKETLVAPISRFQVMFGRTLGGATVSVVQGVLVFLIALAVGFKPNFTLLPIALVFMALVSLLFTALGTAIASHMQDMQGFPLVMNFIIMPLFFLSSALFPLHDAPDALIVAAKYDPLTYGVDGIRGALTGNAFFSLYTDFAVLAVLCVIVLAIGTYMFSKIEI